MLSRLSFILALGIFFKTSVSLAKPYLFFEEYTNRGSSRDIATGGASIAFPNNDASYLDLPAGIPFQASIAALNFSSSKVEDTFHKSFSNELEGKERTVFSGGLSLSLFEYFGIGAGVSSESWEFERRRNITTLDKIKTSHFTIPLSLSAKIFNEMSVALTYAMEIADVQHSQETDGFGGRKNSESFKYFGGSYKLSTLFVADNNLALAATHRIGTEISSSQNTAPSLYIPSYTQLALAYYIPSGAQESAPFSENTLGLQLDLVSVRHQDVYHPAVYLWQNQNISDVRLNATNAFENTKVDDKISYIPKVGIESLIFRKKDVSAHMWLGGYLEPALAVNSPSRAHLTGGLEASLWFVVARYALDIAKDYHHQSLGIGTALQF